MIKRLGRLTVFALVLWAQCATAQVQSPDAKAAKPTFADLIKWVQRSGEPKTLRGWVAQQLRFSEAKTDVAVIQKAFATTDDLNYAFDVIPDQPDVTMARRDANVTLRWRVSPTGKIVRTLRYNKDSYEIVPNEPYLEKWKDARDFFLEQMPSSDQ